MNRIVVIVLVITIVGLMGCKMREELVKVREMPIESVDLNKVKDGAFQGSYSYGGWDFLVQVTVKDHRIEKVDILKAFTGTSYAVKAKAVVEDDEDIDDLLD